MKTVGIVSSGSSETEASIILNEGEEKEVKVEDLVLIENRAGNKILGVCRKGSGVNDNIKSSAYSPGVAYAKTGKKPSDAKEFFSFKISVIGEVEAWKVLKQNKLVIAPCSDVKVFENENPMDYLGVFDHTLGFYKEHPNWKVPINARFIPYHIGIFSVTGGGKSFLARCEVIPFLREAGYDVLIFDWKGSDYVPYFNDVVRISQIALDEDVVISYLLSKMDYLGYSGEYRYRNPVRDALEDIIYDGAWRKVKVENLRDFIESNAVGIIMGENRDQRGNITSYGQRCIRKLRKYIKKLSDEDFKNISGGMSPADLLKLAREKHVLVFDISESGKDEKLSLFLSMANYLRQLMEQKQILNIALVIDEGPQYCPFKPEGIENETTEAISELCALGRSYHLSIVILSQGIAGEIGINAAIRRNLNTQFIGKIHPLDMMEAANLLSGLYIDPTFLVSLPEGHFYFLGNMNPSPIPLLISFNPDSGKR
jgi:hypothetical protein